MRVLPVLPILLLPLVNGQDVGRLIFQFGPRLAVGVIALVSVD